jgi:hypothetical protein
MKTCTEGIQTSMCVPLRRTVFYFNIFCTAFLFLFSLGGKPAFAGPWTLEKGSLYVNYSLISTYREKIKAYDGTRMNVGKIRTYSHDVLVKYGVLDNMDVHAVVPYELSSLEGDPASTIRNFGDGRIGFQYRLLSESESVPVSFALGFEYKRPLSNYSPNHLTSPGEHVEDYEYRFLVGRFFDLFNRVSYVNVEGGYRFRAGKPSDEVFGFGEVGMLFTPKVAGRVFVDGLDSLGGIGLLSPEFGALMASTGEPPFPSVGENWIKTGLGLTFYPTDSIDLGVFWSTPVYRSNTSLDRNMGISIGYKFF